MYETRASAERLSRLLPIDYEDWMQDWPLEVADPARLTEFCDAYEDERSGLTEDDRFALMRLVLYSLDEADEFRDWLADPAHKPDTGKLAARVRSLLLQSFALHLHTIDYWRSADELDPENVFVITPFMREVWQEGFRPEYRRWLEVYPFEHHFAVEGNISVRTMSEHCRESGYPSFTAAFERPKSIAFISAPYMAVLSLADDQEGRAALEAIKACVSASAQPEIEIASLFADYNWRPQIVGACALLTCPETCNGETLTSLWDAFDAGSWVSPQLAVTASLRDPEFERNARVRIEAGCPIKTDRLVALDWATRHSAAGPGSFSAHSSKALAALVAVCRPLDGMVNDTSWLSLAVANPDIESTLGEDREGSDRIALDWLLAFRSIAG